MNSPIEHLVDWVEDNLGGPIPQGLLVGNDWRDDPWRPLRDADDE